MMGFGLPTLALYKSLILSELKGAMGNGENFSGKNLRDFRVLFFRSEAYSESVVAGVPIS